jgi:hypothetical protein
LQRPGQLLLLPILGQVGLEDRGAVRLECVDYPVHSGRLGENEYGTLSCCNCWPISLIILAGACIVRTVMDKLGQQALTVSDRGLRHGLLLDRFGA